MNHSNVDMTDTVIYWLSSKSEGHLAIYAKQHEGSVYCDNNFP